MNFDKFPSNPTMNRQNSLPSPVIASPSFRRRRTVWFVVLGFVALVLLASRSETTVSGASSLWGSYVMDWSPLVAGIGGDSSSSSRSGKGPRPVSEIHGLQHLLINSEVSLSHLVLEAPEDEDWKLDPKDEIDLRVYASFDHDEDWPKHVKVLEERYPLVVFSKSYCPFSKKAKLLLESYDLSPPPKVVEVDLRGDTEIIKVILGRLTNHTTFPNIILKGVSLGGHSDILALHEQGRLKDVLERKGVRVKGPLTSTLD